MKPEHTSKGLCIRPVGGWRHGEEIYLVNPSDREPYRGFTRYRRGGGEHGAYLMSFGAYGWTRLLVWADSWEDALEECVDWLEDHAPGLLHDEAVKEAYEEAYAELADEGLEDDELEERARELAEQDMIACDRGHYLASWEVHGIGPLNRASLLTILDRSEEAEIVQHCQRMKPDILARRYRGSARHVLTTPDNRGRFPLAMYPEGVRITR